MLRNKTWLVALGAIGAVALVLGGAGIVYAQSSQQSTAGSGPFDGGLFQGGGPFGRGEFGAPMGGRPGPGGPFGRGPVYGLLEVAANELGMSEEDLAEALRQGQTVAELAQDQNVDLNAIVEAAMAEAEARLSDAVENGRLAEDQKAQMLEHLSEELPDRLNEPWEPRGAQGGLFGELGDAFWSRWDAVAEALGLDAAALFERLHGGETVADIAGEQGVDPEQIREALEEDRAERMEEAIRQAEQDGRISEDQAQWLLDGLEKGFMPRARRLGGDWGTTPGRGGRGGRMGRQGMSCQPWGSDR